MGKLKLSTRIQTRTIIDPTIGVKLLKEKKFLETEKNTQQMLGRMDKSKGHFMKKDKPVYL